MPTAIAYLTPTVRQRPNLTIRTQTTVTGLIFEGLRCVGITIREGNRESTLRGDQTILCNGALHTPAHLLRAGIGPLGHLGELGIDVRCARAGVGQGLMDHPSVALAGFIRPHARLNGKTRRHLLVGLRFSDLPGMPPSDMAVSVSTKAAWHAVGEQICSVTLWVNKTYSQVGEVRLQSADWHDPPTVDFRLLHDRSDLERLMAGLRRLRPLFDTPAMQKAVCDPFAASFSEKVRQVGVISRKNALLTSVLTRLLDGPEALRRFILRSLIIDEAPIDELLGDDRALEEFVRRAAVGVWHASCSCRMGDKTDPMAVADPHGQVYGVQGLRIADASLFPTIPRANVNLPTIMLAERLADLMLGE